jgi:hypothetical protein
MRGEIDAISFELTGIGARPGERRRSQQMNNLGRKERLPSGSGKKDTDHPDMGCASNAETCWRHSDWGHEIAIYY